MLSSLISRCFNLKNLTVKVVMLVAIQQVIRKMMWRRAKEETGAITFPLKQSYMSGGVQLSCNPGRILVWYPTHCPQFLYVCKPHCNPSQTLAPSSSIWLSIYTVTHAYNCPCCWTYTLCRSDIFSQIHLPTTCLILSWFVWMNHVKGSNKLSWICFIKVRCSLLKVFCHCYYTPQSF